MSDVKKLAKKYLKTRNKLNELNFELSQVLQDFIGQEIRLSKECAEWYKEFGEECGVPFEELNYILSRPKGKVVSARVDEYDFVFRVEYGKYSTYFGLRDII